MQFPIFIFVFSIHFRNLPVSYFFSIPTFYLNFGAGRDQDFTLSDFV